MREARQRQGESLEQVSQVIKIRPSMLQSIEQGQFFGLTDPLYLKGFIRAYTAHVGLQDEDVLPFFRREYDEQEHQQQQLKQPLAPIEPKKPKISPGWLVVGFLAVAIMILIGYSYQQYVSLALTPSLKVDSPQNETVAKGGQIVASGKTDPDATLSLNGQALQLNPDGYFNITVSLAAGINNLQFRSVNKLGKETHLQRTVVGSATLVQTSPLPTVPVATMSASPSAGLNGQASAAATVVPTIGVQVGVTVGPSSAWLEVTADGKAVFTGILLPGAAKSFTATTKVHVKTGNGGSTRLSVHGVDQGILGAEGQVVERDYGL